MTLRQAALGAGLLLATALGCGRGDQNGDTPAHDAGAGAGAGAVPAVERLGPFAGTLPCADCGGIDTRLTLFVAQPGGAPLLYHLSETYRATPDGDRTAVTMGRWRTATAAGAHAGVRIVHLSFDDSTKQRGFRAIGDDSLRMLDRALGEIESTLPYTLVRDAAATAAPVFVEGATGATAVLRPGQEVIVRLAANHTTGFQWALADTTRDVVAPQGTLYVQDAPSGLAVGVGGHEYWRLQALAPGARTVRFVYRRPWEQQPPARTVDVAVTVR